MGDVAYADLSAESITTFEVGYPLDQSSPARYVITAMDRAFPEALSIAELARGYEHDYADLSRVIGITFKWKEDADTFDAKYWLIMRAIAQLRYRGKTDKSPVQLEEVDGKFRLAVSVDNLKWQNKKIYVIPPPPLPTRWGSPFDPLTGRWSKNVRIDSGKDLTDLRESMKAVGWLAGNPAIKDERGVVLVGHRRLAVAKELGIPIRRGIEIIEMNFGQGDEGDEKRLGHAILTNTAQVPFSPTERKEIAKYLRVERGWMQEKIAEALSVSQSTVRDDLADVSSITNANQDRVDSLGRKNPGRPKGSGSTTHPMTEDQLAEAWRLHTEEGLSYSPACVAAGWTGVPGNGNVPAAFRDYAAKRYAEIEITKVKEDSELESEPKFESEDEFEFVEPELESEHNHIWIVTQHCSCGAIK